MLTGAILDADHLFGVAGRTLITNTSDLVNSPSELEATGRLNLGHIMAGVMAIHFCFLVLYEEFIEHEWKEPHNSYKITNMVV